MNSRYLTSLLPLGIAVLGVLDAANKSGTALISLPTILQLILLVATTGAAFWLPLVPGPWAGALKTGAGIVGAIASAAIATLATGGEWTQATWILFLTAALKAVATEVGVQIRLDAEKQPIDARDTEEGAVPVITSVPLPGADEADLTEDDVAELNALQGKANGLVPGKHL